MLECSRLVYEKSIRPRVFDWYTNYEQFLTRKKAQKNAFQDRLGRKILK